MTSIRFYVLKSNQLQARLLLACKLIEKAYSQQLKTYVHTQHAAMSMQLDELLWTYNDFSFIPHELAPSPKKDSPVLIGHDYEPVENCDYLINLSGDMPAFFARFERFAEILDQDETILHAGRKRYQFYRDRGYTLDYHTLG
ncbi:MAG: DNA polymerase III subunit chi [Thiofilum sp.]|uniref:DNA polymerase III subunit chi n=1 Tax=Thiofilum sp. TaxID=2212733 RepID=UPI0025EBAC37|nr:DNA polymerase III subunit chi [Thiofilum sp.]MBK8453373.1 DNA polymerase III subunit chi [Thiofilum sp.]